MICYNPDAAERDAKIRERMLAQLDEMIDSSDKLPTTKRAELRRVISTKPGLNRYLRAARVYIGYAVAKRATCNRGETAALTSAGRSASAAGHQPVNGLTGRLPVKPLS